MSTKGYSLYAAERAQCCPPLLLIQQQHCDWWILKMLFVEDCWQKCSYREEMNEQLDQGSWVHCTPNPTWQQGQTAWGDRQQPCAPSAVVNNSPESKPRCYQLSGISKIPLIFTVFKADILHVCCQ